MIISKTTTAIWNPANIEHYTQKGYKYTKVGEKFEVKVEDLNLASKFHVLVQCDFCGKIVEKPFFEVPKRKYHTCGDEPCRRQAISIGHKSRDKKEKEESRKRQVETFKSRYGKNENPEGAKALAEKKRQNYLNKHGVNHAFRDANYKKSHYQGMVPISKLQLHLQTTLNAIQTHIKRYVCNVSFPNDSIIIERIDSSNRISLTIGDINEKELFCQQHKRLNNIILEGWKIIFLKCKKDFIEEKMIKLFNEAKNHLLNTKNSDTVFIDYDNKHIHFENFDSPETPELHRNDILQNFIDEKIKLFSKNWIYIEECYPSNIHEIQRFKCKKCGNIKLFDFNESLIPICMNCKKIKETNHLDKIKNMIGSRGELLSINKKIRIKCNECNSVFYASEESLSTGQFCPTCKKEKERKLAIQKAKQISENNHFNFIKLINLSSFKGECLLCGHSQTIQLDDKNVECKSCKKHQDMIDKCNIFAKENNLKLIQFNSKQCIWECKHGHRFKRTYNNMLSTNKCPECKILEIKNKYKKIVDTFKSDKWNVIKYDITLPIKAKNVILQCKKCGHQKTVNVSAFKNNQCDTKCQQCQQTELNQLSLQYEELSDNDKQTMLNTINKICKDRGKLLTQEIRNKYSYVEILCNCGNRFWARCRNILNNPQHWNCEKCYKQRPHYVTNEQMQEVANKHNLICNCNDTITTKDKIEWICSKHDYHFFATYNSIKNERKHCPECLFESKKPSLDEYNKLAKERQLKFISETTLGATRWECINCGNTFSMPFYKVALLEKCPKCQNKDRHRLKLLDKCKALEGKLNISLIDSSDAFYQRDNLTWKCNKCDHVFTASFYKIRSLNHCPNCEDKKCFSSEKFCKEFLERELKIHLIKARPDFLRVNSTPRELDMYNEKYKLAFEYQGHQHYQFTPYFHKTIEDFQNILSSDQFKLDACKKKGILLIQIHYFESSIPEEQEQYLLQILKDNHVYEWIKKQKEESI